MRIIAGSWKGRVIRAPHSMKVRPTSDKVKEAIFNIIRTRVLGTSALDLFAGTGSLGLEMLSRGGLNVVFVENNPYIASFLKQNCESVASPKQYEILIMSFDAAVRLLSSRKQQFDVIFIDPPYKSDLQQKALISLCISDLLSEDGIVVVEHKALNSQSEIILDMRKIYERKMGNTAITLYKRLNVL